MSVLIKGMKMPKSCSCCDLRYIAIGYDYQCPKTGETVDGYDDNRHHSCPLVEVPTPHGRLIDADEYGANYIINFDKSPLKVLESTPTIIEAEVSEE